MANRPLAVKSNAALRGQFTPPTKHFPCSWTTRPNPSDPRSNGLSQLTRLCLRPTRATTKLRSTKLLKPSSRHASSVWGRASLALRHSLCRPPDYWSLFPV